MSPDEDLRAARGVRVAVEAFQWTFARSSGAGGQSVNKTSTKATLTILLSDIQCSPTILARLEKLLPETVSVTSQVYRSQWRNRVACMELMCEKLNKASSRRLRHDEKQNLHVAPSNVDSIANVLIVKRKEIVA